ncbi:MAG: DUF4388 domain-containing protein [Deltaproteobacteria bacterium]|nr:DUF4388 domain-containing protein [Candidatus Anaeroferrophillus wilburensis]MBN2888237.1 DUF4388 domain-containing protein [Deltaproteobacteria bacterium]
MPKNNELKGYLGGFDLTDVLQLISQQQKTGILKVESSEGNCSWFFKEGMIVGMSSSLANHAFDLEEMMKKSGRLSPAQSSTMRHEQIRRETSMERVLVDHGILSHQEMAAFNQMRLFEILAAMLGWKKGSYSFEPTRSLYETPYLQPQPSDYILLEILRQTDELSLFEKHVASLEAIYEPCSTFAADSDDALFLADFREQLTAEEEQILALVKQHLTVQEIIDRSLHGRYNVYRILAGFLKRGIIAEKGKKQLKAKRHSDDAWKYASADLLICLLIAMNIVFCCSAFMPISWVPSWMKQQPYTAFTDALSSFTAREQEVLVNAKKLLQER